MEGFMGGLFGGTNDSVANQKVNDVKENKNNSGETEKQSLKNVEITNNLITHFCEKNSFGMLEMKVENPLFMDYDDSSEKVVYGEMIKTSYYSTVCEKDRNVIVLLPAGYTNEKKYPVCYVLHGIFGDETSMIGDGSSGTRIVIGNLIAAEQAKEMILVFPYMYASKTQDVCSEISVDNTKAYDNFVNDLVTDLMPFMEANYSVATGREHTAVIGFSMGGREALAIGLQKSELFGYIGAIAPAPGLVPGKDWAMEHPGQFQEADLKFEGTVSPILLFICCGDQDSVVGVFPKTYHNILCTNNVEHYWWEISGSDHADPAITNGLVNFWKTIF